MAIVTSGPIYLKICTKVHFFAPLKRAKTLMRGEFEIFSFLLFIVCQSSKTSKNYHFGRFFCYEQHKNEKFKIRSHQVFCALEKYLWTNFQVKWSNGHGGVVKGHLFKILVKILNLCSNLGPFSALKGDPQTSIKSEPMQIRRQTSSF